MANPYIPRATIHAWSEAIGAAPAQHQTALTRLLREQRRLGKFIEENRASMHPATGHVAMYLVGVVVRMFDLAGGRLSGATWEQVRAASARVQAAVPELLPLDDGFPERVRKVEWRAQPHILDEALMALFEREKKEDETDLASEEAAKAFFLLWVATEVLDQNWLPPKSFQGETTYTYVKIDPKTEAVGG